MEGNIEVYIDNELAPSWSSSGMEDAFNGGWYNVPVGGYPAGRAGNSDQPGSNHSFYRFFVDDPIFFSSRIKVIVWAGQPNQGSVISPTVSMAGYVGAWLDQPRSIQYTTIDSSTAPLLDEQFSQVAGPLDNAVWNQDVGRTQAIATGSTFTVAYGNANPDEDVRIARKNLSLPADYWVETRVRITDATHDEQQAHLIMLGARPDPYFGSAVHVQLYKHNSTSWSINIRDDFATTFLVQIGSGRDLTNEWVRLAMKKQGAKVTAYYSLNNAPSAWIPVGAWTATKTDSAVGVGTWTAGAEFDYLVVRPVSTVTE